MILYDGNLLYDKRLLYDSNLLYDKRLLHDINILYEKFSYVVLIVLYDDRCAHSLSSFGYSLSHTNIVIFGAF